jgi:hypothetical protein
MCHQCNNHGLCSDGKGGIEYCHCQQGRELKEIHRDHAPGEPVRVNVKTGQIPGVDAGDYEIVR